MRCEFCKGHHHLESCDVYKTASERKARLRWLGNCLRCISQSLPCKCNPNKPCRYCEGCHHFALCPRKFGRLEEGEIVDISGSRSPRASGRKRDYASPSKVPNVSSGVRRPAATTAVDEKDKKCERDIMKKSSSCYFCKGPHRAEKCNVYDTALKRQEQAHTQGMCRRCLQLGHSTVKCNSMKECPHCNRRHHASLCLVKFGARRNESLSPRRSISLSGSEHRKHSLSPTTSKRPRYRESRRITSSRSPKGRVEDNVKVQKSKKLADEERPLDPESGKTLGSRNPIRRRRNEDSELVAKLRKQLEEERKTREDLAKVFRSNLDTLTRQKHEELQTVKRELETMREAADHCKQREKDMDDDKHLLDAERAALDEQKKQLTLDRQAFESERTQRTAQHKNRTVDTSTEPADAIDDKDLEARESDLKKRNKLEEELQKTRLQLETTTRHCEEAHRRIDEQFSKRRLLRDRYLEIMDERVMLQAEKRSLQLTIKFREQTSKRRVGQELQNQPSHVTGVLSSAAGGNLGAAQPSPESMKKANAAAKLQECIAMLQNEFSQEHIHLYSSFIGLNLNSSVGLKEILAFLTAQVPDSTLLAQKIVNCAHGL